MVAENEVNFNKLFQMYSVMAHVVRSADLTPRMRRVTLGGEGFRPLSGELLPADAIKLYLPEPGQAAVSAKFLTLPGKRKNYNVRAYTIRHFNAEALELDIDVLLHGDSPGSVWARTVQPGEQVGFIGPRHDYRGLHLDYGTLSAVGVRRGTIDRGAARGAAVKADQMLKVSNSTGANR